MDITDADLEEIGVHDSAHRTFICQQCEKLTKDTRSVGTAPTKKKKPKQATSSRSGRQPKSSQSARQLSSSRSEMHYQSSRFDKPIISGRGDAKHHKPVVTADDQPAERAEKSRPDLKLSPKVSKPAPKLRIVDSSKRPEAQPMTAESDKFTYATYAKYQPPVSPISSSRPPQAPPTNTTPVKLRVVGAPGKATTARIKPGLTTSSRDTKLDSQKSARGLQVRPDLAPPPKRPATPESSR